MARAIAIIGGTGEIGLGLAFRWAQARQVVHIGSRQKERAEAAALKVRDAVGSEAKVEGFENREAASQAELVVLTVPLSAQISIVKGVKPALQSGTIFVDCTVPTAAAIGGRLTRTVGLWAGSAAEQVAELLPGIPVLSGFQTVAAEALQDLDHPIESDVIVCGDAKDAKEALKALIELIPGARYVDGGPLENARIVEHLAVLLISLNIRYGVHRAGLRITGLPEDLLPRKVG
ncbi:MAG: NADPH-dependent F420 reductase [candidate division NC10 bacterium]|nr:NADPH-dependent F420 reductase [candidate division NC10 bacterium]